MTPAAPPVIRPATRDDIPAIRAILAAHGNDGPITSVDIVGPYVRHLVDHHVAMVSTEGDTVTGYGAVVDAGIAAHLADLFVLPDRLGQGIGRPLLAAAFGETVRRVTFASNDPRALPVYVRAGMTPLWVALYVEGDSGRIAAQPGLGLADAEPSFLCELERAWTGADRPADHAFWASQAHADAFVVTDADGPVALAYARARQVSDVRAIDRMVVRPGADPVPPMLAALRRAGRGAGVDVFLPGPSPLLPALLELGFRIVDRDQYMASAPDLVDPARLLPNPGML